LASCGAGRDITRVPMMMTAMHNRINLLIMFLPSRILVSIVIG
jgi:hypothetical protein